jgi:opacity protein-like surface antigen/outer membrane receptor protein involved in Fe transport
MLDRQLSPGRTDRPRVEALSGFVSPVMGVVMSLRAPLLASASILLTSVFGAFAQTQQQPAAGNQTPAATLPGSPAPAGSPPPATVPAAPAPNQSGGAQLPTITVSGKRKPPPQQHHVRAPRNATAAASAAPPTPTAAAPPSPYETGAPSIGGGPAVAPTMASSITVSGENLNARTIARPGEIVEAAPGLMAIMHADAGKANQYYLRGWNLDHGTDLAVFWDDIPINLPTHAHGQGYTDLNWLIPETVGGLDIRKGPYWADVGDFENAGNLHISVVDTVPQNIESATVGSYGYLRYLMLGSTKAGSGNLLYAGEFTGYDGPWTNSDDMKKFSGLLRYSQGTATDGFSLTAMAYTNTWNSTDQNPLRYYTTGQMGLYGTFDPTDGGDTSRFSLSGRVAQTTDDGSWKANAYLVKYSMDLWNNYTYVTDDPVNGDQFHQHDDRIYGGGGASRTFDATFAGLPTETVVGVQTRDDNIITALNFSDQRQLLAPYIYDHINEGNAAIYSENTVHWTDWLRTVLGWRGDYYDASVDSILQPANSGNPKEAIGSPKFRMVLGPFAKTEFFVGAGTGYHSNDARSTTVTEAPGDPTTPEGNSPFLVRSRGAEVGVRTRAIPNLDSSISLFYIHQDSELFFDGDTGDTMAGLPSQRTGIEFTNDYRPFSWIHIDANLALSRARFLGFDTTQEALYESLAGFPQAQIGNAPGNYVYNAPWMIASAGITLGEQTGWFSDMRWRYISSRPLTEDGVFQSPPMNEINAGVGYRFDNGWRIQLDALNLLNSTTDLDTYAYGSLVTSDNLYALCNPAHGASTVPAAVCANGVMDYIYHPLEPLAFRLTLAGPLETINTINIPAMAAEMKRKFPADPLTAANYDWTGLHVGARVNDSLSKTDGSTVNAATGAVSAPIFGSIGDWHDGVQVGYDYMLPSRVVMGIEADVSSGSRKTVSITDASGTSSNQTNVFDGETVRGRLGYAFNNVLFYGTGGWAWSSDQFIRTQLTGALNLATAGTDEAVNTYLGGWTAGGGVAVAFAQNWNAFAEYRYTDYEPTTATLPFSQLSATLANKVSEVDVGVNYKFTWGPAETANAPMVYKAPSAPFANKPALFTKAPSVSPAFTWTGLYVGGDGGYGWHTTNGILTTAVGAPLAGYDYNVNGPSAGFFAGGNYQLGRFVAGLEGDWQRPNLTGNNQQQAAIGGAASLPAATGTFPRGPFTVSTTIKDSESVRGRLGFAFNRFLVFGTGGFAWSDPANTYALLGSAPFVSNGNNSSGWTAGAGLDYAFTDNVFGRIEYRYTDLKTSGFVGAATDTADSTNRVPISDVRVGLAYKFNPLGDND